VQLDEPTLTEVVLRAMSQKQTLHVCCDIFLRWDPREELTFATELINKNGQRGKWDKDRSPMSAEVTGAGGRSPLLKGDYTPLIPYFQEMKG
jgi:5-methyltetrahydropteroyltriglutamate--homocysteine methyltransferase